MCTDFCCYSLKHAYASTARESNNVVTSINVTRCGSGFRLQFQFVGHNERFNRMRVLQYMYHRFACACIVQKRKSYMFVEIGNGRKSVFRNLLEDFTVAVTNFNSIVRFFLHTFESHVIYGLHFHAHMKHVVPTTSKRLYTIFRMPSLLRYVTKVSLFVYSIYVYQ